MLLKLMIAVLGLALIGAALLSLQQQRLLMAHAMSDLHVQMDRDRKQTWDAQAAIAERSHPVALRESIRRVGLDLEPLPSPGTVAERPPAWPDPTRFEHAPGSWSAALPAPRISPPPIEPAVDSAGVLENSHAAPPDTAPPGSAGR